MGQFWGSLTAPHRGVGINCPKTAPELPHPLGAGPAQKTANMAEAVLGQFWGSLFPPPSVRAHSTLGQFGGSFGAVLNALGQLWGSYKHFA